MYLVKIMETQSERTWLNAIILQIYSYSRKFKDSRGNPTIEVEVLHRKAEHLARGMRSSAPINCGWSIEAIELRDGDKDR